VAARENLELAGLQFENHGARDTQFLAGCAPGSFRETPDRWLSLGQQHVVFKSVLRRYGLRWPVRRYFAFVDASSQLVETRTEAAEVALQGW